MGFNSGFKGLNIQNKHLYCSVHQNCVLFISVYIYIYIYICIYIYSRYSDWLRAGRSGDRIPVGARFSALVQTGPGAHSATCTMGTGSFPGVKNGRGVTLALTPSSAVVKKG